MQSASLRFRQNDLSESHATSCVCSKHDTEACSRGNLRPISANTRIGFVHHLSLSFCVDMCKTHRGATRSANVAPRMVHESLMTLLLYPV